MSKEAKDKKEIRCYRCGKPVVRNSADSYYHEIGGAWRHKLPPCKSETATDEMADGYLESLARHPEYKKGWQ